MHSKTLNRTIAVTGVLAAVVVLSACSSGDESTPSESSGDLTIGAIDLSEACPATVVIQTDWNPESEHGHLYELLGDTYEIDAGAKSVTGPLLASGEYTGVDVEIRAGGPAIGFQTVSSQMYQDTDITLGYVSTDEAIQLSSETPTKAVYAPLDISPTMVMWDPETYPDVETIDDILPALSANGGVWRYFDGSAYIEYLKSSGLADDSILDGSYDGTPANFVAAAGKDMQQGFASAEPYIYENEVEAWGKPVGFSLIHDSGWETYQSSVSVRTEALEELTPCLELLVPVLQQAGKDFYDDPAAANALILDLVEQYLVFINDAEDLKLELAADYLVMAAWLAYLKSGLLLPRDEQQDPSPEEMALRLQLRLQRLSAMRDAGARLMARDRIGRDVFVRSAPEGLRTVRSIQWKASLFDLTRDNIETQRIERDRCSRTQEGQVAELGSQLEIADRQITFDLLLRYQPSHSGFLVA